MATTITGILKPFGIPIANAVIRVTSLSNDGTIKGVYLTRCTNENGEYNFHLENGVYSLEYRQLKVMVPVGNVYISDNTPPVLTLEELMNTSSLVPVPDLPTTDADWDALLNEHNSNAEKSIDINQATSGDAASIDYEEASSTANSFLGRAVDTVSTPIGKSTKQVIEFSKGSNALAKEVDTLTAKEAVMESSKAIYADANYTFDIKSTLHLPDLELVDRFQKVKELSSYSVKDHERIAFVNSFLEKQRTATTDLTGKVTKLSESRGDSVTDNFVEASVTTSRNIETSYRDSEGVLVNAPRILEETSTLVDGGTNHSKITQGYEQRITKDDESLTRWYQKVTTYLKEGLDEITNNGFTSLRKFIYDKLQFGDVLFVDNVKKEVKVQGKLIIENREDFTGDTIFEVFQYSVDGVTLWHDIFAIEDRWRRHNTSVNGYVDPSKWSAPYLLQAEDGHEGDTLYIQYRYSANMVNWHATFVDGDIWRQERIIENGYPITEWSTPARIIGADGVPGDTVTIEYQYSIDGLEPWHNNFSTGDHYRRERLITNGVAGAWSQPAKLVPEKDVDYTDGKDGKDGINGAKSIILHLYKRGDTAGSMVSTVCTYNFTTKTLTGFNNGWSPTVPSGNGAIWLTVATASSIGETDTVAANEWATPIKFSDGGKGVAGVVNEYGLSASAMTEPANWTTSVPSATKAMPYLWNREIVTYSDGASVTTPSAIIGMFSEDGRGIASVTEYYLASASSSGVTTATTGWTTTIQHTSATKRFLWNYEVIAYTDGTTSTTTPVIIGTQGVDGNGVAGIVNYYLISDLNSGVTVGTAGWATSVPIPTKAKPYLWNYEKVTYSNGAIDNTPPALIGTYSEDGVSITGVIEYYQVGTSSSVPPANQASWPTTAPLTTPTNKYLWNYEKITYSNGTSTSTAPVVVGVHGEKGDTGVGINSVVNEYGLSASAGTEPSTWTATVPTATKVLPYLWNREIVTYTNGDTVTTPAAIIGMFTEDGKGIASVTEYYLASSLSTGVTTATAGWTTAIQHTTVTNRFLWNYEVTTYTDGSTNTTAPVVIGTQGINGVGVSSIVNYYLISAAGSGVTTGTAGWTQAVQIPTKASRYLWNYEKVTYTNGTVENTQPAIIGTYSENGVSITGVTEYYQVGTSGSVAPADPASWPTLAPLTSPTNKYLWNYEKISYSDGTTTSTTPVVVGIHGEKGDTGVGITSVVNEYGLSNSPVTQPASWSTSVVTPTSAQRYLWNREKISYTDSTVVTTSAAIIGMYSEDGKGIVSITEWYLVTNNTTPPANDDARWTTTLQIPTETNRYLWNKEVIKYTVGADTVTPPVIIGIHGTNGIDGYNAATLFIYQRTANQPALPTANVTYTFATAAITGLNGGWSPTIPAGTGTIWVSTATALSQSATDTIAPSEWAVPVVLAQSGEAGKHGAGSYIVVVSNVSAIPADAGKDNHILQLSGRPAQAGDMLTYTSPTGAADADKFVKQFIRGASTWEAFVFAVDGSAVINGTLAAQALKAESAIVDKLYISDALAQNEMTLSGKGDYRLWAGGADPLTAMFSLDKLGNIIAKNGTFKGRIEATSGTFTGAVNATSGTFTGVVNATSGNFTGKVNVGAGYIQNGTGTAKFLATNNGNFYVDHNGKVYAKGGIYGGARIVAQGEKVLSDATTLIAFPSQFSELYRKDVAISPSGQQGEGEYYTDRDGMIFSTGFTSLMHHTNNRQYIVAVSIGGTWTYYINQQINAKAGILATVVPMLKMDGNSYYYDAEIFIHCKIVGFYMSAKTSLSTVRWKLIELLTNPEEMV